MHQTQNPFKENDIVNDIRIQQFLDAARAYLFGIASPQVVLATIPVAVCRPV